MFENGVCLFGFAGISFGLENVGEVWLDFPWLRSAPVMRNLKNFVIAFWEEDSLKFFIGSGILAGGKVL